METLNYLHNEHLIVELKPEEAETMEGGGNSFAYERYTTKNVSTYINIRSGPDTSFPIIGKWYRGQVKLVESPAILMNGFLRIISLDRKSAWVSKRYIKPA